MFTHILKGHETIDNFKLQGWIVDEEFHSFIDALNHDHVVAMEKQPDSRKRCVVSDNERARYYSCYRK